MFYKPNHIYKCYWNLKAYPDEYYLNLIKVSTEAMVSATCIFCSGAKTYAYDTKLYPTPPLGSVVIDLGHRDDLPEYFI